MGLTFTVGNPSDVYSEPHADRVRATLEECFGRGMNLMSPEDPWYSDELGWSGWEELQDLAKAVLPEKNITHFLSMPAWQGVYIHADTEPGCIDFGEDEKEFSLCVGGLRCLANELLNIGKALELALDNEGLRMLADKYLSNDDLIDDDMGIQTYAQLSLAILIAKQRNQPLWVVK